MDQDRFDRIARALGRVHTRRAGIGVALAGVLGTVFLGGSARGLQGIEPEGPCGNGSGPDNRCSANSDCCTNYCDKAVLRCRCLRSGERCKANQTCCGNQTCVKNVCSGSQSPTQTPNPTSTPTGTLTPSPTPTNTPVPEPCTVCASGCQFTNINAAVKATPAGGTITVAPGTWVAYTDVTRNLTIRGCASQGGSTSNVVIKEPDPSYSTVLGIYGKDITLTLSNLTVAGSGTKLSTNGLVCGRGGNNRLVLDGVKIDGFGSNGIRISGCTLTMTNTLFTGNLVGVDITGSTVTGTRTDFYGDSKTSWHAIRFYAQESSATLTQGVIAGFVKSAILMADDLHPQNLTLDSVTVRSNTGGDGGYGAGINAGNSANIVLKGTTSFRNNRATGTKADGGAIRLKVSTDAAGQQASLKIIGSGVEFRNNDAAQTGSGSCPTCAGAIEVECNQASQVAFSRVQAATYASNTPVSCAIRERASGNTQKEVPNCKFG